MDTHPLNYPCLLIHQFNCLKGVTRAKQPSEVSKNGNRQISTLKQAQRSMISTIEYIVPTWPKINSKFVKRQFDWNSKQLACMNALMTADLIDIRILNHLYVRYLQFLAYAMYDITKFRDNI